jgi:hypothetical protein
MPSSIRQPAVSTERDCWRWSAMRLTRSSVAKASFAFPKIRVALSIVFEMLTFRSAREPTGYQQIAGCRPRGLIVP